jgi:AraC-like DNA-binding protein
MRRQRPDDNLLLYCTAGSGWLHAGSRQPVRAGDLALLPAGDAHAYGADDAAPWTLYWAHFRGAQAGAFIDRLGFRGGRHVRAAGLSPTLAASFDSLLAVRSTGYSHLAFVDAANHLRHLLTRFALATRELRSGRPGELDLAALQSFMRSRLHDRLSLDELAAVARLSRHHFVSRYRSLTGVPPMRHFLQMKMEAACRLLDDPGRSVKAVSAALGYTDALYFSRAFKGVVGLSPRDYRASVRR